jgi:hypothetical protein
MRFFKSQWRRRSILWGLAIHFAFWWVVSAWFWTSSVGWTRAIWASPIEPIELGVFYLWFHEWKYWFWGVLATCLLTVVSFF